MTSFHIWDPLQGQAFQGDLMLMQLPERMPIGGNAEHGGGGIPAHFIDTYPSFVVGYDAEQVAPRNEHLAVAYGWSPQGRHMIPLAGHEPIKRRMVWQAHETVPETEQDCLGHTFHRAKLPEGVPGAAGLVALHASLHRVRGAPVPWSAMCCRLSVAFLVVKEGLAAMSEAGRATIIIPPGCYLLSRRWQHADIYAYNNLQNARRPFAAGEWSPHAQQGNYEDRDARERPSATIRRIEQEPAVAEVRRIEKLESGTIPLEAVLSASDWQLRTILVHGFGPERILREAKSQLIAEDMCLGRRRRLHEVLGSVALIRLLTIKTLGEGVATHALSWPGLQYPYWKSADARPNWYHPLPEPLEEPGHYCPLQPADDRRYLGPDFLTTPHEAVAGSYGCSAETFREAVRV
jgi:hypothetical protein